MFFDTHVHFDDFAADGSLAAVLERAAAAGIGKMIAIGGNPEANQLALKLAEEHPGSLRASVGFDRNLAGEPYDMTALRELAENPQVVAIGETGLDYCYEPEKTTEQKRLFAECLALAAEIQKPVVVHSRDADDDTLAMLREFAGARKGDPARIGVLHCFTRDQTFAEAVLNLGFCISFSGIVTFANAGLLRDVAKMIPADRLLIETDSPYLAPVPHRGKRCEPAFMVETAKRLAEVRGCTVESIKEITAANARALFSWEE
jgi:TatD DNase family protein